jgi:hypothetical protein
VWQNQWTMFDESNSRLGEDMHALAMNFSFEVKSYRYRLELFDENMVLLKTLKDVEIHDDRSSGRRE